MKTIKDLGALVKKEYPEYNELSDEEVGRLVKARFPDAYSDFIDTGNFLDVTSLNPLVAKASELVDYYKPNRGRFTSWWQRGKAEARGKLQIILSAEQMIVLEQAAQYEQAVIAGKMRIIEYNSFIAQNQFLLGELKAKAILITDALEEGYTSDNWQEVKLNRESSAQRKDERSHDVNLQIRLLEQESKIRLHEFREMESVKFNNEVELWREKTRLALIAKTMTNHQKKILVQELLDNLYLQIEDIERGRLSPNTKRRMIEDREAIIRSFREYSNELQLL